MCSINHDLKAVYVHIHKTGGTAISMILNKHYGFKNYYLHRPDHHTFCFQKTFKKYINYENRFHGVITYYKTSSHLNRKMNMTPHKWNTYFKFCFIRNPYDKIVSAWNHVNRFQIPFKNYLALEKTVNDVEYMHMFMPQYRSMINEKAKEYIDYIGKFENLEDDFLIILKKLGITNFTHDLSKKVNARDHNPFYEYYQDQETLDQVNHLLKEDFEHLSYTKFEVLDKFQHQFNVKNDPL